MRYIITALFVLALTACTTTPDPKVVCDPTANPGPSGVNGVGMTDPSGNGSCGGLIPCNQLPEATRKTVSRCQTWEETPWWRRVLLRVIYRDFSTDRR